jgi:hypothetical protein
MRGEEYEMAASLGVSEWSRVSWLVSERVRGLLGSSPCELLVLKADR